MNKAELAVVPDTYERLIRLTLGDCLHVLDASEAEKLARQILHEVAEHVVILPEDEIVRTYQQYQGQYGYGTRWLARKYNTSHTTIRRILVKHNVL